MAANRIPYPRKVERRLAELRAQCDQLLAQAIEDHRAGRISDAEYELTSDLAYNVPIGIRLILGQDRPST